MEFKRIVAVTGMPGLFEVLSSKNDGALVRSLEDQSTKFVSSRVHNMSHLESIEVYTNRENVQLTDVFAAMKASKEKLPDLKDNNSIKAYFEKVYPDMDFERVYASDMKKMVKWYSVIDAQNIDFTPEPEVEEEEAEDESTEKEEVKSKATRSAKETKETKATKEAAEPKASKEEEEEKKAPAKKAAAKKTAAKTSATKSAGKETEDKPKKAAAKKKKED